MNWPVVTLLEALASAEVFVDGDWVESKDQDPGGDVRLVQLADVGDGEYLNKSDRFLTSAKARELRCTFLKQGDLLVARMPDPLGRACIFPGDPKPSVTVVDVCIIRPDPQRHDARWLMHCLNAPDCRNQIAGYATGTTRSRVSRGNLAKIRVPLPPLPEQRRIAEILDKADTLRATRRGTLAQLEALTQSIFLDMFGDLATNPRGWPVKRLDDITECLDRLRLPVTESDRKPGNVPYYGANGQQGWIDTALFDEPLVLVAEDGGYFDAPERGVAYRIDGPAWVNNHAHILRAIPPHVDTEFLHRALRHFNFSPFISGTTRAKLTQGQLSAVKLYVPPLDLQRQFGERVASVQRIMHVTASSADQLDELFAALQYRAFRGEL